MNAPPPSLRIERAHHALRSRPIRALTKSRGLIAFFFACFFASLSLSEASAQSASDERARTHFMAGSSYFEEGQYDQAGDEFMKSYRLSERPELLLNAGMAYERAGAFDEASAALRIYLERIPEGSDEARALSSRIRHLDSRAEEQRRIEAELEEARLAREAHQDERSRRLTWMGWSGVGAGSLGAVSLVASLATGLKANSVHGDLDELCGPSGASCPTGTSTDIKKGERLARASTATLITGAALGAGAAVLIILDLKRAKNDEPTSAWRLDSGPGELGLSLRRDF